MRNVLFVTVDSLRADHVGWHGYERDTTPNLDELAADGHAFENAFAHACSTRPSFPSILASSSALMYGGYERMSEDRTLVSEVFDDAGYDTGGFHSNLYLSADFGYGRGYDEFYDSKTDPSATARLRQFVKDRLDSDGLLYQTLANAFETAERQAGANIGSAYVSADDITDRSIEWATGLDDDAPKFLWTHYMDVHHPYVPPEKHQRAFRDSPIGERRAIRLRRKMIEEPESVTDDELSDIVDLYDAEIRFTDAQVARLVETVRDAWSGDTLVAFTADHGEEFLDHGQFSHYATFYDDVLHVPLFLHGVEGEGRYDEMVGLQDVAPTLVEYSDLDVPGSFHGNSLRGLIGDDTWDRDAVVGDWENDDGERRFAYRDHDWKYIERDAGPELYDLNDGPDEKTNLVESRPEVADRLAAELERHRQTVESTTVDIGEVEMEAGVKERLRDLGYQE